MKVWNVILMVLLTGSLLVAEEMTLIEMVDFSHRSFTEEGLLVKQPVEIEIHAQGAVERKSGDPLASAWILEAVSRDVVWSLIDDEPSSHRGKWDVEVKKTMTLEPGSYEVYFAAAPYRRWGSFGKTDLGDFLSGLFDGRSGKDWRRESKKWGVRLTIDDSDSERIMKIDVEPDEEDVVSLTGLGDDEYEELVFQINSETEFRLYAIGEGSDGEMYDYGMILDATTGERVWEMAYRKTDWAGGGIKNRKIDEKLSLDPGTYRLSFVTDDSHSPESWNRLLPYDPHFWGITLWPLKGSDVRLLDQDEILTPIVNIDRVGNDTFRCEGFTLKRSASVRVRCLGELGYKRYFADYGWILNARTREKVWSLSRPRDKHAGGGKKNRMFDGVIDLEPGDYQVCYQSDDSHSYNNWNVAPPYNPAAWGITVWGADPDFDKRWITTFSGGKDSAILVQFIRVTDDRRRRDRFVLKKPGAVRIYALGEGDEDHMYDYGWIEDEEGEKIWRMGYEESEHAGGAKKNRRVNKVIDLEAGEYRVFYKTDGSHSFDSWNSEPPEDAEYWGITVRKEE